MAEAPGLELGFETQAYQSNIVPQVFPVMSAGYSFESATSAGDPKIRISPTHPKAFAILAKNLYWGREDKVGKGTIRFSIGRHLFRWAKADELWNLGQFENLDQWDRLRPSMQGLTGAFAQLDVGDFRFGLFASGVFVPEMTPNVVIENQEFVQEHPQSIASVPKTINILNQQTPLGYNLVIPSITSILFRPSFAASVESTRRLGIGGKLSYGYLPLNYFPIALQAQYSINLSTVAVNLQPRLLHHHVYNGEVSYRTSPSLAFGLAVLVDQPVQDEIPSDYTTSSLTISDTWTPWVEFRNESFAVTLSQIVVAGGLDADTGPFASQSGSIFSSRMLYRNASQVAVDYRLLPGNLHDPRILFKYIHEYSINGDWISGDFLYSFSKGLGVTLGGDVLSSYLDASPDRGAEFIADMRALGRVRLGVTCAL